VLVGEWVGTLPTLKHKRQPLMRALVAPAAPRDAKHMFALHDRRLMRWSNCDAQPCHGTPALALALFTLLRSVAHSSNPRARHMLASHTRSHAEFRSPLSQNQEVSAFGSLEESNSADNWQVVLDGGKDAVSEPLLATHLFVRCTAFSRVHVCRLSSSCQCTCLSCPRVPPCVIASIAAAYVSGACFCLFLWRTCALLMLRLCACWVLSALVTTTVVSR
jgi:hypothetical protein